LLIAVSSGCGDPSSTCGDGTTDPAEECDDGNAAAGDGCSSTCIFEVPPNCGDAVVDYADNEECDDGNRDAGDGCDSRCRREVPPGCGDGALNIAGGEQCDDGNTANGDGCTFTCQFEVVGASCGNGTIDPNEVCDDGNTSNGDGCNPTCNFANTTSLFVGAPGMPGLVDGTGGAARIRGGLLAVDATYLWHADSTNRVIRRIEIATGTVATIAGDVSGGPAGYVDAANGLSARFSQLEAIATDGTTLWIGDAGRIRAITVAPPHAVTTVAGQGPGATYTPGVGLVAAFDDLRGLTYYAGKLYVLDAVAGVIARFDPTTNEVVTVAGTPYTTGCPPGAPVDGTGAAAVLCSPRYMTSDNSGNLFVADTNGATVRAFNTSTGYLGTYAGTGTCGYVDGSGAAAAIHRPRGLTSDGTSLYWNSIRCRSCSVLNEAQR
jgi:cysteine-rich repeat protein